MFTVWIICCLILYAYLLYQEWNYRKNLNLFDFLFFGFLSFSGPIGIIVVIIAFLYVVLVEED